jgi:hypothetical protein
MTEEPDEASQNDYLPEVVAPVADEDEPAELEELEPVEPPDRADPGK